MIRAITFAVAVLTGAVLCAQAPSPNEFEVASVRPNPDPPLRGFQIQPGGRLAVTGFPLSAIIQHAVGVPAVRIVGMPEWTKNETFDISAKAPDAAAGGTAQVLTMLRMLLGARFALTTHTELRDLPIYELRLATAEGRTGPTLRPSTVDCTGFVPGRVVLGANGDQRCAVTAEPRGVNSIYRLRGRAMAAFASDLQMFTSRPVVDATALAGIFDIELQFASGAPDSTTEAITLFTAVREQLGLRLEPARGPVEVVVIDSVGRPTPN